MHLKVLEDGSKVLHMKKDDALKLSPSRSPIMFDTFHALYVWFLAVEDGNVKPLIDFLVDGKYN